MILLLLALISGSFAKEPLKVAILDTGLNIKDPRFSGHICRSGSVDLTDEGIQDSNGHGTHIAGLVIKYAGDSDYCLMIYKYYGKSQSGTTSAERLRESFQVAIRQGAKIINLSGGGDRYSALEYEIIKAHPETLFIVAAGNDGHNLDEVGNSFYPASYRLPNIIAVGNEDTSGRPSSRSNYAPWLEWEVGVNVISTAIGTGTSVMTGSSMSTAIRTGKLIRAYNH